MIIPDLRPLTSSISSLYPSTSTQSISAFPSGGHSVLAFSFVALQEEEREEK